MFGCGFIGAKFILRLSDFNLILLSLSHKFEPHYLGFVDSTHKYA